MEYERIQRPQRGGGLSPAKLRSMLMGVEKKRKEVEEVDSSCSLRSGIDDPGCEFSESCKDVDVVQEHVECSTSTTTDSEVTSNFEFQKTDRGSHNNKVPAARFSKPAPSKWDDAQKWIASPTSNRSRAGQGQGQQGQGVRKITNNFSSHGGVRKPVTKIVAEVPDGKLIPFEEPETKMIDSSAAKNGNSGQQLTKWESDPYSLVTLHGKAAQMIEKSVGEPMARSVSMKDMGTEMTPIASQEPSRSGTPVKVKSPALSPTSSRASTPRRAHPPSSGNPGEIQNCSVTNGPVRTTELSERELHTNTRKEIMELGMQLGKMNITSWASKEDGDTAAEVVPRSVVETRADAWEEAERAKYTARFEREEMKIQAWENHQKAKTEAEMKKIEVEVERMKAKAQDKIMSKLAAVRHKAEEKRAAAEGKMHKRAAKSEQEAEYIRKTGRIPSKFSSCWSCCC